MRIQYGNPSSGHSLGRGAKAVLDGARKSVAAALGARPEEIVFTSGGTESDNWALISAAEAGMHRGKHIISTAIEHDAVLKTLEQLKHRGFEVTLLKPDKSGYISVSEVENALREDTVLVSVMMVNNEVGSVMPVADIARMLRARKSAALLHTDAVQGFLKIPFSAAKLGADLISVSSHKIHGPKGAGALYIRSGTKLKPLLFGGGQENGLRSGTEAIPAIAGFGAAAEDGSANMERNTAQMAAVRSRTAELLRERVPEVQFIGSGAAPHILCISLPGHRSEVMLNFLDSRGICVSRGSACKKGRRSHVLESMGLPPKVIDGAVRLSFSEYNTEEEAEWFAEQFAEAARTLLGSL